MQVQVVAHAGAGGGACRCRQKHDEPDGNVLSGERAHPLRHWSGASSQAQATMNFC